MFRDPLCSSFGAQLNSEPELLAQRIKGPGQVALVSSHTLSIPEMAAFWTHIVVRTWGSTKTPVGVAPRTAPRMSSAEEVSMHSLPFCTTERRSALLLPWQSGLHHGHNGVQQPPLMPDLTSAGCQLCQDRMSDGTLQLTPTTYMCRCRQSSELS